MIRITFFFYTLLLAIFCWSCNKNIEETDLPDPTTSEEVVIEEVGIGDLPAFFVDTKNTAIPNEPKIPADFRIIENGSEVYSGRMGIELRGSTSRRLFEKKSYGFETWDENNEDMDVELLGLPAEEDWILYGPYADKTLLRNTLIYDLSNQMDFYAVRAQFVELVINEEYMGVYAFMEKLKRDKERIDLKKLEAEDVGEDQITGGYILKLDKTSGDNENDDWPGDWEYTEEISFRSDYDPNGRKITYAPFTGKQGEETYFLYEYPDYEDINEPQRQYIQNYIREFEEALLSDDFNSDTPRKYMEYIDIESFAQFFILNELSSNPDAYRISTYLNKQRGGKLKMGPIWDFNLAFGLDERSTTNVWIYEYNKRNPSDLWLVPFWWNRLLEDPLFRAEVKAQWQTYRTSVLSNTNINRTIEAQQAILKKDNAIERNFKRWEVLGIALPFNSFVGKDYESESNYLKDWISNRAAWMDGEIRSW